MVSSSSPVLPSRSCSKSSRTTAKISLNFWLLAVVAAAAALAALAVGAEATAAAQPAPGFGSYDAARINRRVMLLFLDISYKT